MSCLLISSLDPAFNELFISVFCAAEFRLQMRMAANAQEGRASYREYYRGLNAPPD
jgi:hypothetical protein